MGMLGTGGALLRAGRLPRDLLLPDLLVHLFCLWRGQDDHLRLNEMFLDLLEGSEMRQDRQRDEMHADRDRNDTHEERVLLSSASHLFTPYPLQLRNELRPLYAPHPSPRPPGHASPSCPH